MFQESTIIRFGCPICKSRYKTTRPIGSKGTCGRCGSSITVPNQHKKLIITPRQQTKLNWKSLATKLGIVLLLLTLGTVVIYFTAYGFPSGAGLVQGFSSPSTCKEMVERIQSRGVNVRWVSYGGNPPSVILAKCKDKRFEDNWGSWDEEELRTYLSIRWREGVRDPGTVLMQQFSEERWAKEEAGRLQNGFYYGRFVFRGDPVVLRELEKILK